MTELSNSSPEDVAQTDGEYGCAPDVHDWRRSLVQVKPRPRSRLMTHGTLWIGTASAAALCSFTAWATLAPLDSAIVAPGFVKVSGNRQKVQHLEGGIVGEILVKDGDEVETGQVVARIRNTQLLASRTLLQGQLMSALALEARIKAEQIDAPEMEIPDEIAKRTDKNIQQYITAQQNIFLARNVAFRGSLRLKDEKITQIREEIKAYIALADALRKQMPLIRIEIEDQTQLWDMKLARKRELHALRRTEAQIEAEIEKNMALIARARATIAELEEDKLQVRRRVLDELAQERKLVNDQIYEFRQRLIAVDDAIDRLEVRAPISGVVVMLSIHTPNGVIGPREVLMEVVPKSAQLVIETSIRTNDIDIVRPGMTARVQFGAYTARRTNKVDGVVKLVSADRIIDSQGRPTYKVDVVVPADQVLRVTGLVMQPGMPADAFIETGERTLARYVLAPVLDSFDRGMREP